MSSSPKIDNYKPNKLFLFLEYIAVLSVLIMGFNQAIITLFNPTSYKILDAMTVGAGLFILLVGAINLFALYFNKYEPLLLSLFSNSIALAYVILINTILVGVSSLAAIVPFIMLIGLNIVRYKKLTVAKTV